MTFAKERVIHCVKKSFTSRSHILSYERRQNLKRMLLVEKRKDHNSSTSALPHNCNDSIVYNVQLTLLNNNDSTMSLIRFFNH